MATVSPEPVAADTGDFVGRVEAAQKALAMTVSLFPELVQHLEATRQPVQTEEMRKAVARGVSDCASGAVRALNVRNALVGAGLLATALLVGAVGGYLFHGAAPVIADVSAGAQQCQDQKDGGQICWIPVWGRLPPPR